MWFSEFQGPMVIPGRKVAKASFPPFEIEGGEARRGQSLLKSQSVVRLPVPWPMGPPPEAIMPTRTSTRQGQECLCLLLAPRLPHLGTSPCGLTKAQRPQGLSTFFRTSVYWSEESKLHSSLLQVLRWLVGQGASLSIGLPPWSCQHVTPLMRTSL